MGYQEFQRDDLFKDNLFQPQVLQGDIDLFFSNTIELLKRGDKKTLEKIYMENREGFINFSKKQISQHIRHNVSP